MKIREIVVQWTNEDVRQKHCRNLVSILTPNSIKELFGVYQEFSVFDSHEVLLQKQQDILKRVIELECSSLWKLIREEHGLDVLTLDTEI